MRIASQPSFARSTRFRDTSSPRMRRPSPLPSVIPTRSSWLQRLLWLLFPKR